MSQGRKKARDARREKEAHDVLEGIILQVETFIQLDASGASNMVRRMSSNNLEHVKYQGQAVVRVIVPTPQGPMSQMKPFEFEMPGVASITEAFERFEEFADIYINDQKEKAREMASKIQAATAEETAAVNNHKKIIT